MRKLVLASLLALVIVPVAGCKRAGSQKLEGRWRGVKTAGVPEAAQVSANAFAANSEIIAQGNQITVSTPGGGQPAATYTVDKEDGASLVIHTDRDERPETFTFNDKADEMVWKVDERRSITFRKAPQ